MGMGFVMIKWKFELLTVLFICFSSITVGESITLTPTPAYVLHGHVLELTCKSNRTKGFYEFFYMKSEQKISLGRGGGSFQSCLNETDTGTTIDCDFGNNSWKFTLLISNPEHNQTIFCKDDRNTSVNSTIFVAVPVTSVTLAPTSINVTAGQQMYINCTTSYCYPPANITWYMSSTNFTNQFTLTKNTSNGLVRTLSALSINASKSDNGKRVYCTASNISGRRVNSTVNMLTVLYKPEVIPLTGFLSPYRVIEGQTAALKCALIDANPYTSIIWRWSRTYRPEYVLYSGPNYTIPNIQRNMSGTYNCTASNSVGTSEAGITTVDVLYKPKIADTTSTTVNESDRTILSREIVSNPLSNVSWYNGSKLLDYQVSVAAATLTIEKAMCTDTRNFTLIAGNTVERNVSALVELIVHCKPRSYSGNITLGVTDTSGIDFTTTVIAYPEPRYELRYENGTTSNKMMGSITRNDVNNFTIRFNQTAVKQDDFGIYRLLVSNPFGETVVVLTVIPQRKPNMPERVEIVCEVMRARVQWRSSFDGGDPQSFTVIVLNGQQRESRSDNISDKGENVIHLTFVQNLQPSTTYVFYVTAQNRHGLSSSEKVSCTTLEEDSTDLPFIAGGAAAGGITLAIVLVVVVVVLLRLKKRQNKERNFDKNNPMRTNEDASHYTTLAEQDVTVERNVYEILTQKEGTNQYEACLMKESQETNSQMYESLQKTEISDKRNISDKHMIAKYTKDLSNIYANQSAAENSSEYINLSFSK
ncbi:nephrin isoform X2 [Magallana gigas]|uniref:nephrin isoform X2 n=1 Tax=Magallana gigas TaxID=29159 RepID=UPI003342B434